MSLTSLSYMVMPPVFDNEPTIMSLAFAPAARFADGRESRQ
ncbi:hypothetical protein [Bradyrhizobium sp. 190]|nr:hypothetical protein [Bradyrhizobium sp. 190]